MSYQPICMLPYTLGDTCTLPTCPIHGTDNDDKEND